MKPLVWGAGKQDGGASDEGLYQRVRVLTSDYFLSTFFFIKPVL